MLDGVLEAAQALTPEDVPGDTDDEDVVRLLPQHELERHASIRAADDRGEGDVWRRASGADPVRPTSWAPIAVTWRTASPSA